MDRALGIRDKRRARLMLRAALAAAAALALIGAVGVARLLAPAEPLPARFEAPDCGRVALTDALTGHPVSGAEDLAIGPDGRTLIVSAHDRTDRAMPDGGLYAVDLAALAPGAAIAARPLSRTRADGTPFRPHGIALSSDGRRLAVINRVGADVAVVETGPLGPDGWEPDRRLDDGRLCRANDLAFTGRGDALEITIDRADCGLSLRDLAGETGSLVRADAGRLETARTGLDFPNGVLAGHVAESRGRRLLRPDGSAIDLPGAPDNLTAAPDGFVAAVHPSLFRIWLYLQGWSDRAPARILLVGPGGAVEVLYDDPDGTFSAATTAVLAGDRLVAGSVRDAGLLVCGGPSA